MQQLFSCSIKLVTHFICSSYSLLAVTKLCSLFLLTYFESVTGNYCLWLDPLTFCTSSRQRNGSMTKAECQAVVAETCLLSPGSTCWIWPGMGTSLRPKTDIYLCSESSGAWKHTVATRLFLYSREDGGVLARLADAGWRRTIWATYLPSVQVRFRIREWTVPEPGQDQNPLLWKHRQRHCLPGGEIHRASCYRQWYPARDRTEIRCNGKVVIQPLQCPVVCASAFLLSTRPGGAGNAGQFVQPDEQTTTPWT